MLPILSTALLLVFPEQTALAQSILCSNRYNHTSIFWPDRVACASSCGCHQV